MQPPKCPICSETYNRRARCPKVLQCGHTFCNACLSDWEIRSLNGIECPKCRSVEGREVNLIPPNYETLEYLEAHIDPRLIELVRQNNGLMAQSQRLLDDCRLKKLPVLEDNKKNIDDFNRQIMEVIQIIEQLRDSVNASYEDITSNNQAILQPYIDELQNYVNTTDNSIRQANQLIDDFDADYDQLQALFKNHTPTLRVMLERFNAFGSEKFKNLRQIVLQLNNQDPYTDPKDEKSIKSNEKPSSISHGRSICNICRYRDKVVFLTRLDCNHSFCTDCLKKYLDYKINTDLLKRKGIECCICDFIISDETIKKVVDPVTYYEYISKMKTRKNITLKCPKKHRTIVNGKNADCQKCGIYFCIVCKKAPHNGICQKSGFRTHFGFRYEDVCPECNKRNRTSRNSEGNYIICKNPDCNTSLCKYCYERYSPILAHGQLYHRFDCKLYQHSDYEPKYNPLKCEECKKLRALCRRPSKINNFK